MLTKEEKKRIDNVAAVMNKVAARAIARGAAPAVVPAEDNRTTVIFINKKKK